MRKVLIAAAALLFCGATPAMSQQILARHQAESEAALEHQGARAAEPALYPSTDQVKADVRANEQRLNQQKAPIGTKDWWYLVAAIAIGVIVAAVIL